MSNLGKIVIDTWLIEAHEAVKLVEEVETRVNSKNIIVQQDHLRLSVGDDIARSKLLEAGIKLDRLESLLHNPPAKPILTEEDLEHRWRMLSDTKIKMKALAFSLYATPSPNRTENAPAEDMMAIIRRASIDSGLRKPSFGEGESQLLKPLVSDTSTHSHILLKRFDSSTSASFWSKACWAVIVFLGAVALVFVLALVCAVI